MTSPNPLAAFRSILRARRTHPPRPAGSAVVDHTGLEPVLTAAASGGVGAIEAEPIGAYSTHLESVDPDDLTAAGALAFWINLYNAGALDLARRAFDTDEDTVLRVPGGFTTPFVEIAGESLTLDDVEHGKIRRFGDPRIHAALVCGSASCPTLRSEPYSAAALDAQLDDQMRAFLAAGGAAPDRAGGRISLSRVFLWYGADFVRPDRMPTLLPARRRRILRALERWLDPDTASWAAAARPRVEFSAYDWSLGCAVRRPDRIDPQSQSSDTH